MFESVSDGLKNIFRGREIKVDHPLGRDGDGIEIWNRSFSTLKEKLFLEDPDAFSSDKLKINLVASQELHSYWNTPAGTIFNPEEIKEVELLSLKEPKAPYKECFKEGAVVLELGCGGGQAAREMAERFPNTKIHAIDHEWGKVIPTGKIPPDNLQFNNMSWNSLEFPDNHFDTILSLQGVGRYGASDNAVSELTRVAKPGALLRVDKTRGIIGHPEISDILAEHGWDVYLLKGTEKATNLIVATLETKGQGTNPQA